MSINQIIVILIKNLKNKIFIYYTCKSLNKSKPKASKFNTVALLYTNFRHLHIFFTSWKTKGYEKANMLLFFKYVFWRRPNHFWSPTLSRLGPQELYSKQKKLFFLSSRWPSQNLMELPFSLLSPFKYMPLSTFRLTGGLPQRKWIRPGATDHLF